MKKRQRERESVCVCVCVCERERERKQHLEHAFPHKKVRVLLQILTQNDRRVPYWIFFAYIFMCTSSEEKQSLKDTFSCSGHNAVQYKKLLDRIVYF